jgi:hypothetical protein
MKITPELIPHSEFHKGTWLISTENPCWYYFLKKRNPNHVNSRDFLKTVDGPLRELVKFLHAKNIKTTPSCSGHHFSKAHFTGLYNALLADREKVRNGGIELVDVQNDRTFLFKKKDYDLPWSRPEFVTRITEYQKKGILGIRLHDSRVKKELLKTEIKDVRFYERAGIVFIHTSPVDTGRISYIWKAITRRVKEILA